MFRLHNQARPIVLIIMLVTGSVGIGLAKCADSVIRLYGEVVGDTGQDLKLKVEICPRPRRPTPVAAVKNHHFDVQANFDTFIAGDNRGEYCGRIPESIVLVLTDGSKEVTRITLDVEKDFVRDEKTWDYTLREGLKIQIPSR